MDATREYVNQSITGSPYLGSTGSYAALYNTYKCFRFARGSHLLSRFPGYSGCGFPCFQ